jgi:hypothetical protein
MGAPTPTILWLFEGIWPIIETVIPTEVHTILYCMYAIEKKDELALPLFDKNQ